jgi:hypothetical protein
MRSQAILRALPHQAMATGQQQQNLRSWPLTRNSQTRSPCSLERLQRLIQ